MIRSMNGRPLKPDRATTTYTRSRISNAPSPTTTQINRTIGPAPLNHSYISVPVLPRCGWRAHGVKVKCPLTLSTMSQDTSPVRSHRTPMTLRHSLLTLASAVAIGACAQPAPVTKTPDGDSVQAKPDTAWPTHE